MAALGGGLVRSGNSPTQGGHIGPPLRTTRHFWVDEALDTNPGLRVKEQEDWLKTNPAKEGTRMRHFLLALAMLAGHPDPAVRDPARIAFAGLAEANAIRQSRPPLPHR